MFFIFLQKINQYVICSDDKNTTIGLMSLLFGNVI